MLRECLELGVADGWADPRFPTIRGKLCLLNSRIDLSHPGLRRRGMTAETMVQYLLSVGPSQNQMWLEWDGIWSLNKRIVDPIVPRYTALDMDKMCAFDIISTCSNPPLNSVSANISGDYDPQGKDIPRHKKNPTLGMRPLRYGGVILLEKSDVDNLKVGDEVRGRG
jgi:glutamyl-tRNA synthetase